MKLDELKVDEIWIIVIFIIILDWIFELSWRWWRKFSGQLVFDFILIMFNDNDTWWFFSISFECDKFSPWNTNNQTQNMMMMIISKQWENIDWRNMIRILIFAGRRFLKSLIIMMVMKIKITVKDDEKISKYQIT